jgi:hypothetical protein
MSYSDKGTAVATPIYLERKYWEIEIKRVRFNE